MHFWPFFYKNFNLSGKDELLYKNKEASNFWIILRKVHARTKKSINRSGVRLRNPAQ